MPVYRRLRDPILTGQRKILCHISSLQISWRQSSWRVLEERIHYKYVVSEAAAGEATISIRRSEYFVLAKVFCVGHTAIKAGASLIE